MNKKTDKKTVVVGALALLLGSSLTALAGTDNRAPEVPFQIAVDPGNKVQFHGFGVGFIRGMLRYVKTATTPGALSAAVVSSDATRPFAIVL